MLTTLLDDAEPGRRRLIAADVVSVACLAARLRFGAPGASERGRLTGEIARKAIIANLVLQSALAVYFSFDLVARPSILGLPSGYPPAALVAALCLSEVALGTALILGRRRTGLALSAVALVILTAETGFNLHVNSAFADEAGDLAGYGPPALAWLLQSITLLAVFPAFHRDAPAQAGRPWWFLAWVLLVVFSATFQSATYFIYILADILVAAFIFTRARSSPVWSMAFPIAAWPIFVIGLEVTTTPLPVGAELYISVIVALGLEAVLIALTLTTAFLRRRRRSVAA